MLISASKLPSTPPPPPRSPRPVASVPSLLLLLLSACSSSPPPTVTATPTPAGVRVDADAPIGAVEVRSAAGIPVARRGATTAGASLEVVAALPPGEYTALATVGTGAYPVPFTVSPPVPVRVQVQPSPGGPWLDAAGEIPVPLVAGGAAEVLIGVTGGPGMPAEVGFSAGDPVRLEAPGARVVRSVRVADAPVELAVGESHFTLVPAPVSVEALAREVSLTASSFPAEADGSPDLGRPAGRVTLPSPTWERVIRAVGLGGRRRDAESPWAFWGIALHNDGDRPVDLQLSLVIEDGAGPAAAFRPRLRSADGTTGTVVALLRVPAHGDATAALPVFVDPAVEAGAYTARVSITPLGGSAPLHTLTPPLYVQRGDAVASTGFVASLVAFVGGAALTLRRLRPWLDAAATSELMTIALFGSALFLVGTAADLIAMGIGTVLGPLSSLFTGIVGDLGRYTLLATLVTLLPRTGTLTLALLTGWVLRGFTTGAFAPVDVLYTGTAIGISEGFAWAAGLTRGGGWRDAGPTARWLRLSVGFAGASACTTLAGLWMHVVLYRLFFAPWYMALQVLGPGFLYTVFACRIATSFAASLRRVEA